MVLRQLRNLLIQRKMKATLDRYYVEKYAWHRAMIVLCVNRITRKDPLRWSRGVTEGDVEPLFPKVMRKELELRGITRLETYENRMRGCVNYDKTMGRHEVVRDGMWKRHFFSLACDEDGLIRHDGCRKCQKPQ